MLYGNESISHYSRSNIAVWMLMAFQAGVINMGGFMACHRFVSHVTGFATFFGHEVAQGDMVHAWGMLVVPLFFLFGAMISGQLVDIRLKKHKKPKYYITFSFIFILTLLVFVGGITGYFGIFGDVNRTQHGYSLLILLCLTCGIQNGTITSVSKSVIRTTHLTGITTDLGVGLVRLFNYRHIEGGIENDLKATFMRTGIIVFFGLGSVVAGFVFGAWGHGGFFLPVLTSGVLLGTMVYFQVLHPRKESAPTKA